MATLLAGCSSTTLPPAATAVASHWARQSILPSGLTVFVEDDSTLPVAGVVWTVRCGAARDPVGREGLAHAVEHLLFRAPATAGLTRYDSLLRLGAADLNGETSFDQTRYHAFVPQVAASELLAIWAAAMADPLAGVDEATFALEMGVVREELSYHDLPCEQERAREALARAVFPARHPYARPIGGTPASLAGIRLADARAFAAACYQPRNMTLVLAGPILPSAFDSVLATLTASLRGDQAHPVAPSVPPAPGTGAYPSPLPVVTEVSAPVTVPEVWVGWALPPGVGVEANARHVLTRLLGGLLNVGLEDEGDADSPRLEAAHIALGVSGGQLGGVLTCRARLPAGGDPEREADAIIEHVSSLWLRLNEEQSWFERVRINATAEAALDTSDVVVRALEEARLLETDPRARPGDILQRTSAVSYAEALGWARNFLRKDQARVVVVRPSEGVAAPPAAARVRSVLHGPPSSTAMALVPPGKRVTDVARPMGASQAVTKGLPNGLTVTVMRRPGAALTSLLLGFRAAPDPRDAPAVRAAIPSAWQLRYFHRASEAGIEHRMHVNADSISERIEVIAGREAEAIAYLGRAVGAVAIEWPSDRFQRWATMQHTEEDRPVPRARRAFTSALWRGHLYGAQPLVADLEAVESRDLERWLDRVRQPGNGTLIVVGDVDPDDTFRRVEDALGSWKKAAAPANAPPAPPNVPAGGALRVLAQSVSGRGAATLELGCLLPSARDEKQRTINRLLARLVNERLRDSLRQQAGASYAPHASAHIYDGGAATLAGSADVDPAELPLALETARALFDRGAAVPFDGAALDRVRWTEAREGNLRDRTTRDVARALFVRWELGWPLATLDEAPARLEAATLGDVEAALQTCRASAVVSVVGDPQSLIAAGIRN